MLRSLLLLPLMNMSRSNFSTMKSLRVLVDMDMVLCNFESYLLDEFRRLHPDEPFVPLEERNRFYVRDQYEKLGAHLPDKIRDIYNSKGFFLNLPEIPGALDAVKEMSTMDEVEVFLCTSPIRSYEHCLVEKYEWVERHLGKEWLDKILLVKDKTVINAHLLIDDRPNIKGAESRPLWEHVVFTACHNRKTDIRGKKRLENWTDGTWRALIEDFKKRV